MANDGTVKIGVEVDDESVKKSFDELRKSTEKSAKSLESVNNALKLDPSNVDLLREKQKLLTSAIADSKSKVEILTKELEKAKASGLDESDADAYRNLVVALSKAESEANGFEQQLSSLNEEMDDSEKKSSSFSQSLSKLGGIAKGALKGIAVGASAAGAAVGVLAKQSLEAYSSYEQLTGGVETLFKDSADIVMGYAENAYKTAGLSANQYMDTVTSFSASLLQSLDGDTAAAAEKANLAITDMSDNANKMGTTMESIQYAYQGFAKQNYTMLDNLKLGYGGTKEEMQRLLADAEAISGIHYDISSYADVVDAIHVIQTEMGITGTTAKEASTTIEGSLNAAKAAWENLLTGMGGSNANFDALVENFVSAVSTAAENILPRLIEILSGVGNLIVELAPIISEAFPVLIEQILPPLLDAGVQIITALANGIVTALPSLVEALPTIITSIVTALQELLPTIVAVGSELLTMLTDGILQYIPEMLVRIPDIIANFYNFLAENGPGIIEKGFEFLRNLVDGIMGAIPEMIAKLPEIIKAWSNFMAQNYPAIISGGIDLLKSLISGIIKAIPDLIAALPQIIAAIVEGIGALMGSIIDIGKEIVKGIWEGIKAAKDWVVGKVKGFFGDVVDGAKSFLGIKSPSRLFRDQIGKNIGLGVADGIEAAIPSAEEAMQSLSEAVMDSADTGDMEAEFDLETDTSGAEESGEFFDESMAAGIEYGRQGVIDAAVSVAKDAVAAARAVMAEFIPGAAASVAAANSAMSPVAASTPRFTSENALSQAAGMLAMAVSGNASREIVFNVNGKEMARALVPDIRSVESQSPAIQYN